MKKHLMLVVAAVLLVAVYANAGRGRPGLGTAVGAGVGALVGSYSEKEVQAALNKVDYSNDYFSMDEKTVSIKFDDGTVPFYVKNSSDGPTISRLVRTLNKIEVTKKAEWSSLHATIPVCVDDTTCIDMVFDVNADKSLNVYFDFKDGSDKAYVVRYISQEPGVFDYVWNFILNHIIWVAIIGFSLLGYAWDVFKKKKAKSTKHGDVATEITAESLDQDKR